MPDERQAGLHRERGGAMPPASAIPRAAHIPGAILLAMIWAAWLLVPGPAMYGWGVSGAAMQAGRYENLALHMFAHAGLLHIGFNSVVLFSLAGPLLTRMARSRRAGCASTCSTRWPGLPERRCICCSTPAA